MIRVIIKIAFLMGRYALALFLFLLPLAAKALTLAIAVVAISLWCLRIGIARTAKVMAEEWLTRAIKAGFPPAWEKQLYRVLSFVAYLTIIAGWIVIAFTLIFIERQLM